METMMKSLAVINKSAPFGNINYRESLDITLANASYDRPIALFFSDDGVFQLLNNTDATLTGNKELSKTFGLLEMYDVEDIYFCQSSLAARGLCEQDLIIGGQCLTGPQWFAKLAEFAHIVTF